MGLESRPVWVFETLEDSGGPAFGGKLPQIAPEISQKRPQKPSGHLWSVQVKLYYVGPRERLGSEAAPT